MKFYKSLITVIALFFSISGNAAINQKVVGRTSLEVKSVQGHPIVCDVYYPIDDSQSGNSDPDGFWILGPEAIDASISTTQKQYPLVVFSPGWATTRRHSAWFAQGLAKKGYIVAIVEHYGCSGINNIPEYAIGKIWLRPKDITKALDTLLADERWGQAIDKDRIGISGFSLGTLTSLWLAGVKYAPEKMKGAFLTFAKWFDATPNAMKAVAEQDWAQAGLSYKDARFKAIFLMGAGFSDMATEESLKEMMLPVHMVVGDKDMMTPAKHQKLYAKRLQSSGAEVFKGPETKHMMFINRCTPLGGAFIVQYCQQSAEREPHHNRTIELAAKFFGENLKG